MSPDLIGTECGICHEEAFRLVERKAFVTVKCCPRCARRLDANEKASTDTEVIAGMSKFERKGYLKEQSHEWAQSWHGKHVTVVYDVDDGRGGIVKENCHINGMATYASKHTDRGWGRVKVVLDKSELHRVCFISDEYGGNHAIAVIDNYRWGLGHELIQHGYEGKYESPLCFYINWGSRLAYVLQEFDEDYERVQAQREQKRLRAERDREAALHMGEYI